MSVKNHFQLWRCRLVFLVSALIACCSMMAQGGTEPSFLSSFRPDKKVYNFGKIKEKDGKVSHVFRFTNGSKIPVAITMVDASCGCTTAEYTREVIRPGKSGMVKVTFNPAFRPGHFSKEVRVLLNNGRYYVRCWVEGNVVGYLHPVTEDYPYAFGRGLYMSLALLPFSSPGVGQTASLRLGIANDTDKPMTVTFTRHPNNRVLKMPDRVNLAAKERRYIDVSYTFYRAYFYDRQIWLHVNVNGKPVKSMKVIWFGSGNVLHVK